MATEDVLVMVISGLEPIVVVDNDPELIGQAVLDHITANPTAEQFTIVITHGVRNTP